jgi:signal peptidase I
MFFNSPQRKARTYAKRGLEVAAQVWNFRRDLLTSAEAAELSARREEVGRLIKDRTEIGKLKIAVLALEAALKKTGGNIFPRNPWSENVEFFLAAAIAILGFKAYFLKPMVIPTNSMWPSYYGMTAENFPPGTSAPGPLSRIARLVAFGAVRHETDAPVAGEVSALLFMGTDGQLHLVRATVDGRSWLILSAKLAEYTLFVNNEPVKIRVPEDFDHFEQVFMETYFPNAGSLADQWARAQNDGQIQEGMAAINATEGYRVFRVPLGRTVNAGDPLIRFDLLKGDMVFVDCLSYHFVRPKPGSGFVFETENIAGLAASEHPDEYLIKRLVGLPGDSLEIKEPVLYRNGKPIEGAAAFEANARREGKYRGYFNLPAKGGRYLLRGQVVTVPAHSFMALGDNSSISDDGRYWGFVPEADVIGRPIFVYYPFTRRWGFAQ